MRVLRYAAVVLATALVVGAVVLVSGLGFMPEPVEAFKLPEDVEYHLVVSDSLVSSGIAVNVPADVVFKATTVAPKIVKRKRKKKRVTNGR